MMNLAPTARHRIEIGEPTSITIFLVGCGGTGSFAALHLARLAYEARRNGGPKLQLIFVDPDVIEPKNIGRQNFCPAEAGLPKAAALASRYNLAFGLEIGAVGHCPNCGELIFEGRDTIVEEIGEEDTVFCPACDWQMYREDWDA